MAVGVMLVENLLFVWLPVAARGHASNVIIGNNAISHIASPVEQVEIEVR